VVALKALASSAQAGSLSSFWIRSKHVSSTGFARPDNKGLGGESRRLNPCICRPSDLATVNNAGQGARMNVLSAIGPFLFGLAPFIACFQQQKATKN
jgi:hypothetical protein